MKLNVAQKILAAYVVGFVLLMAFAVLTFLNGKKIEATTIALSQEKIPGLIAAASLKSNVQAQSNHLYELYATNNQTKFATQQATAMVDMKRDTAKLRTLAEFAPFETALAAATAKQRVLSNQFVQIMNKPEVDWDGARAALADFSASAADTSIQLDRLVNTVAAQTLTSAKTSQQLTQQLINLGLLLAALTFLGVVAMAYYSHRQIAVPLTEISDALASIVARKDLKHRITQRSNDEIGKIALASNNLLEEFQKVVLTLDGTAQELNRTTDHLIEVTESAKVNMMDRNTKLRAATQAFMGNIEASAKNKPLAVDADLHHAQMQFIQAHLNEIDEGKEVTERNVSALKTSTAQLNKLAKNMHSQIRLLNF